MHWLYWLLACVGIIMLEISHGHYTIDVLIAYYITTRVFWTYHTLANNANLKVSAIIFPQFQFLKICKFIGLIFVCNICDHFLNTESVLVLQQFVFEVCLSNKFSVKTIFQVHISFCFRLLFKINFLLKNMTLEKLKFELTKQTLFSAA